MTSLRRYLFGLLAVCTAFAVGIALGGGPLQGQFVDAGMQARGGHGGHGGRGSSAFRADTSSRLDSALTAAVSQRLLHDKLSGQSVTVVALAGVPDTMVNAVVSAVQRAGGLTPVVARLSPFLLDPRKKTYVDSVAAGSLRRHPGIARSAGHDTYSRIGAVLARAYVGSGAKSRYDGEARDLDAQLQGAHLVTLQQTPVRRGSLVVVLAPAVSGTGAYATASHVILSSLVKALAGASDGAVLLAPGSGRAPGGVTKAAAGRVRLSTVNVTAGRASSVVTVYALLAAANGAPGAFGVTGKRVVLPPGLTGAGG